MIWDPFLAAVQRQSGARILQDGGRLSSYRRFYLAATPYAQRRPDVMATVFTELQRAGEWIKKNPGPAAEWHAPVIGLDAPTVEAGNCAGPTVCRRWMLMRWPSSNGLPMRSRRRRSCRGGL